MTSDNLRWALYASGDSDLALFIADRPWLAHALAAGTLLLELGFPLVLLRPRAAWLFVPGAVLLHVGIWLAMGLDYSAQAATVVVVFTNWPVVVVSGSCAPGHARLPLRWVVAQAVSSSTRCGFCPGRSRGRPVGPRAAGPSPSRP